MPLDLSVWIVAISLLAVGLIAGFFMHRSDFCFVGAFRDLLLFRSFHRFGSLILAITVAATLIEMARLLGWLQPYPFSWYGTPSMVNVFGGFLFGIGMVFAGGCVVGVLYKFGGGSVLAVVAIVGLLVGSGIYAEFHPAWIQVAKALRLHDHATTLPQLIDIGPFWPIILFIGLGGYVSLYLWRQGKQELMGQPDGYIPLWISAVVLAFLGLATIMITGLPMGVTTTYAKTAAWIETLAFPEHVAGLTFFNAKAVSLSLPTLTREMSGNAGAQWDVVALLQAPLIVGIVGGAMLSAALLGELKFFWKLPLRQVVMVFCGGVIMALGSRMTPGCNLWHLLGGVPILAAQSLLFVLGLFPGTWLGGIMLKRILI